MLILPNIIEKTGRSTKLIDIPSKLYEDGIITLFGEITDEMSYSIITQLLYLDSLEDDTSIDLYINSIGGSVYAGLAIHDTIRNMKRKVNTIVMGMAASMGAFLLASGTGVRSALPNARIMIHSVSSGTYGTVHDMSINMEEVINLNTLLTELQSSYTKGKSSIEEMNEYMKRDKYLTPEKAIELGLIDKVVKR